MGTKVAKLAAILAVAGLAGCLAPKLTPDQLSAQKGLAGGEIVDAVDVWSGPDGDSDLNGSDTALFDSAVPDAAAEQDLGLSDTSAVDPAPVSARGTIVVLPGAVSAGEWAVRAAAANGAMTCAGAFCAVGGVSP